MEPDKPKPQDKDQKKPDPGSDPLAQEKGKRGENPAGGGIPGNDPPPLTITRELQDTFNLAVHEAVHRKHEYLTLEHLLYALLREKTCSQVILNCGGDIASLKRT